LRHTQVVTYYYPLGVPGGFLVARKVVKNMKTIFQITPLTKKATRWIENNLEKDALKNAYAVVVGHRYIYPIYEAMLKDGLKNKHDFLIA